MRFKKGEKYRLNKKAIAIFNVDGLHGYDYVIACDNGFWAADCMIVNAKNENHPDHLVPKPIGEACLHNKHRS